MAKVKHNHNVFDIEEPNCPKCRLDNAAEDLFKELKESTNMFEILVGEDWLSITVKNFLVEQIKRNKAVIEKATAE